MWNECNHKFQIFSTDDIADDVLKVVVEEKRHVLCVSAYSTKCHKVTSMRGFLTANRLLIDEAVYKVPDESNKVARLVACGLNFWTRYTIKAYITCGNKTLFGRHEVFTGGRGTNHMNVSNN